jgi:hypothetical protein
MRKAAVVLTALAGLMTLAIGLYLLVAQPSIGSGWLQVYVDEMGSGSSFDFPAAATVLGALGVVFGALILFAALVIPRRFVLGGSVVVAIDIVACIFLAISPNPRTGVFVWAVPGLLMAAVGVLLGLELQRVHEPQGEAEL